MADPTSSLGLTRAVLDRLQPVAEPTPPPPAVVDFQDRFRALPQELQDHVVSFLWGRDPLPMHCTRLLPQEHWGQLLADGRTLSFLWDLDADMVGSYLRRRCVDGEDRMGKGKNNNDNKRECVAENENRGSGGVEVELDFEHLVRMLSQPASRGPRDADESGLNGEYDGEREAEPYDGLPDGLRNRRRIWQLVEEMFVGDVLPVARRRGWAPPPPPPTMPRYWHEDGRPAHPVIRVLGIMED